jgi:putative endonuclease
MADWFVYMIRCSNNALYTGITTDVERRTAEHRSGNRRSAKYTRFSAAVERVYQVKLKDRRLAARVEYRIKQLTKADKETIVQEGFSGPRLLRFLKLEPNL